MNDGELDSNVATVTLTVAPVNDAPVAADDGVAPRRGHAGQRQRDRQRCGCRRRRADRSARRRAGDGTLDFAADGSFTYSPDANFNGTDSFTYRAADGSLDSDVVTVTLAVAPMNDVPVAADDTVATDEDIAGQRQRDR